MITSLLTFFPLQTDQYDEKHRTLVSLKVDNVLLKCQREASLRAEEERRSESEARCRVLRDTVNRLEGDLAKLSEQVGILSSLAQDLHRVLPETCWCLRVVSSVSCDFWMLTKVRLLL